ncbi:hypothetical protein HY642_02260 [Candidatus Woesearchaeota archaeon]|nr:hypothetical protein [Candidatus Woesearchaeota archaeon]
MRITSLLGICALFIISIAALVSANPTLDAITSKSVNENQTLTFNITASAGNDSGSTAFTKNFTGGTLTKLNDTLATFTYTPTFNEAGTYSVRINASDSNSSDAQTFTLTVNDVPTSGSLKVDAFTLGGTSQERKANQTGTLTVTNNGSVTLTNIVPSFSQTLSGTFNVRYSPTSVSSLAPGASTSFTVTADIPSNLDAVNSQNVEAAVAIGSNSVTASDGQSTITGTGSFSMQAENNLEVRKVKVTINGDEKSAKDGGKISDILPGDKLEISVELENKFSDNEDIDIEDVEVKAEVDDSDFDLDETEDIGTISADEIDTARFSSLTVDDEASGRYTLDIDVTGKDENGAKHGEHFEVKLEVDRQSHDVKIRTYSVSPTKLGCGKRDATVNVKIVNIGKNDEDNAAISVENSELNVSEKKQDIQLDKSDSTTRSIPIIVSSGAKAGTYTLTVKSFWENTIESDAKTLNIAVDSCDTTSTTTSTGTSTTSTGTTSTSTGTTTTTSTGTTTTPTTTTQTTVAPKPRTAEKSLFEGKEELLLGLGIVVVLALIIMMLSMLRRPKAVA